MDNITISVIIPTFNSIKHIEKCLNSVYSQSKPADEIIVVDDGSNDETCKLIQEKYPKVRIVKQENSGPAKARNNGVSVASCKYIAFLDSDDFWDEEHLKNLSSVFYSYPHIKWAATPYKIHEKNKIILIQPHISQGVIQYFDFAYKTPFVWTGCVMFETEAIRSLNGFNEIYSRGEDIDLWFRFAMKFPLTGITTSPTANYIKSSLSLTNKRSSPDIFVSRINNTISYMLNSDKPYHTGAVKLINIWIRKLLVEILKKKQWNTVRNLKVPKTLLNSNNKALISFCKLFSKNSE